MRSLESIFFLSIKEHFCQEITRKFILLQLYDNKEVLLLRWSKRHLSVYFGMLMAQL